MSVTVKVISVMTLFDVAVKKCNINVKQFLGNEFSNTQIVGI